MIYIYIRIKSLLRNIIIIAIQYITTVWYCMFIPNPQKSYSWFKTQNTYHTTSFCMCIYIYLCMYTYFKQDKQQSTSKIFQKPIWLWHFPPLTTINPSSHWSSAAGPGLSPAAGHLQWAEPGAGQPRCWVSSYDMCRTHANGDTVYNIILYIYIYSI